MNVPMCEMGKRSGGVVPTTQQHAHQHTTHAHMYTQINFCFAVSKVHVI